MTDATQFPSFSHQNNAHHTSQQHGDSKVKNKKVCSLSLCNVHLCRKLNEILTALKPLIIVSSLTACYRSHFLPDFLAFLCLCFQTFRQSRGIANRSAGKAFPQTMILRVCLDFPHFKDSFRKRIEESLWHHRATFLGCRKWGVKTHRAQISATQLEGTSWTLHNGFEARLGRLSMCSLPCQPALALSYTVFYAEWKRIHCASDVVTYWV